MLVLMLVLLGIEIEIGIEFAAAEEMPSTLQYPSTQSLQSQIPKDEDLNLQ